MKMNDKGATLVEITAGFLMLVVIMTSFIKIIKLSSEMTATAVKTKQNSVDFDETYYNGFNYKVDKDYAFRTEETGAKLQVNVALTELKRDENGVLTKTDKKISLNNISIYQIENVKDLTKSRSKVFRYYYKEPAIVG